MSTDFNRRPAGSAVAECPLSKKDLHWIEIELVGEDEKPIPDVRYQVHLPNGSVVEGYLDDGGFARIAGIADPGSCRVTFPELDAAAWDFVTTLSARSESGSPK